jgi:outer membrane lipoprotein-sorting protein
MKKRKLMLTLAAIIALPVTIYAQSLDEILKNHFEAINQQKLLTVNTVVASGKAVQMGMELPFTQIQKRPAKTYLEVEIQNMKLIQAFDGENGWTIEPWTGSSDPRDMGEQELKNIKQQANIDGDLYDWKNKGYDLELTGKEDMEGSEVFNLKLTKNNGDIYNYYIDSEAFVILKLKSRVNVEGNIIETETILSDYKPVDGVIIPHSSEMKFNGQTMMQLIIEKIEINAKVDDTKFVKPVK